MVKIDILSDDLALIEALKNISNIQVQMITIDNIDTSNADVLVVSNKFVQINKLLSIKLNDNLCFYLSDENDTDIIEKIDKGILNLKNIIIVPPKRTVTQIQEFILNKLFDIDSANNVFTFFGADSKVGTTSIVQNVGENLAKRHKSKNILMLFLDGQTGFDWVESSYIKTCLADIKVALKNKLLSSSNLKENCYRYMPNFYMLKGELEIKDNIFYHQDEINELINLCKENFDFIIIDAGNTMNLQLRMTYSALINSDNKILITDQLPKSYEMYIKGKNQILRDLAIDDFRFMVLNKYMKNNILLKKEEIVDKYNLPIISTLPYIDFYYQAAAEKNASLFEVEKAYKEGIMLLVEYIEKKRGLIATDKRKTGLFAFMRK